MGYIIIFGIIAIAAYYFFKGKKPSSIAEVKEDATNAINTIEDRAENIATSVEKKVSDAAEGVKKFEKNLEKLAEEKAEAFGAKKRKKKKPTPPADEKKA